MPIAIQPYTPQFTAAVQALNARIRASAGGSAPQFAETPVPPWLPRQGARPIYQEFFLAVDGLDVRGAFILKHQRFSIDGEVGDLAFYHGPVSEGIVDRAYASVGVSMLRAALKAEPSLFALGMGGLDRPLPQMLKALGWYLEGVPFRFFMRRPARALRGVTALNRTAKRRALTRLAAWSGAGWAGVRAFQASRTRKPLPHTVEQMPDFSERSWLNDLWDRVRRRYRLVGERDAEVLNILYPADDPRFHRLRVSRQGRPVGWVVMLDTQMRYDRHFGELRLGSIIDGLADPDDAHVVISAARRWLSRRGVDLIVSNQSHAAWVQALDSAGFLTGPSNFIFGASKGLQARLGGAAPGLLSQCHLTRGDGDGPIHL